MRGGTMTRQLIVGAILLATTGVALPCERHLGRRGPDIERWKVELGLSESQVRDMTAIRDGARRSAAHERADIQVAHAELRDLLQAPEIDQKAVDAKIHELGKLHEAAIRGRVEARLAARKLLTPEQLEKARELRRRPRRAALEDGGEERER